MHVVVKTMIKKVITGTRSEEKSWQRPKNLPGKLAKWKTKGFNVRVPVDR